MKQDKYMQEKIMSVDLSLQNSLMITKNQSTVELYNYVYDMHTLNIIVYNTKLVYGIGLET